MIAWQCNSSFVAGCKVVPMPLLAGAFFNVSGSDADVITMMAYV